MEYYIYNCTCVRSGCPVKYSSRSCPLNNPSLKWSDGPGEHAGRIDVCPLNQRLSAEDKAYVIENWPDKSPLRMHAHLQGQCTLKSIQNLVYRRRKKLEMMMSSFALHTLTMMAAILHYHAYPGFFWSMAAADQ